MLPPTALTHYANLSGARLADAAREFADASRDFMKGEAARSSAVGGEGFAARYAALCAKELKRRTQIIIDAAIEAHSDFGSPLHDGVEGELVDLGMRTLNGVHQGLEGTYQRFLEGFGYASVPASRLAQAYPLHDASVRNVITRHIWTKRHVPMKNQPPVSGPTFQFNAPVGAVLTGAGSTASVQQTISTQIDSNALAITLDALIRALEGSTAVDPEMRAEAVQAVREVGAEAAKEVPNKSKVKGLLRVVREVTKFIPEAGEAFSKLSEWATSIGALLD